MRAARISIAAAVLLMPLSAANALINLGDAVDFGVIAGPNTKSIQFSNSVFNGNIGVAKTNTTAAGNYVQFSSGTINGNFDFSGTAQTNLGAGTLNGIKNSNVAAVTSAYNQISTLSSTFGSVSGTAFDQNASALMASNGALVNGNYFSIPQRLTFYRRTPLP
jgi:hypothetical protein